MSSDFDYNCLRWVCGVLWNCCWNWNAIDKLDCGWFMCSEAVKDFNLGLSKSVNWLFRLTNISWMFCDNYQRTILSDLERFVHHYHNGVVDHHGGSGHGEIYQRRILL